MKTAYEALKIVTHEEIQQPKNPLMRMAGFNPGDELDSTRLVDLLCDLDGLKRDIHERVRRIEALQEANSWLQEDASRTELLNKRLTEVNKLMHALQSESFPEPNGQGQVQPDIRPALNRAAAEAVAIAWPRAEESRETVSDFSGPLSFGKQGVEDAKVLLANAQVGYDRAAEKEEKSAASLHSASQRLEEAQQFYKQADQLNLESRQRADQANLALAEARVREEAAASDLQSARQELTTAYQFASVAAQRRYDSAQFFERTARWALFAAVSSWIGMFWMGWIALVGLHKSPTVALPILGTIVVVVIGLTLVKLRVRESEDR